MGTNYYLRTNVCEHCKRYDELANIRVTADVKRLGRLVTLFDYHTTYELMKAYIDAGLQNELSELTEKAGEKLK